MIRIIHFRHHYFNIFKFLCSSLPLYWINILYFKIYVLFCDNCVYPVTPSLTETCLGDWINRWSLAGYSREMATRANPQSMLQIQPISRMGVRRICRRAIVTLQQNEASLSEQLHSRRRVQQNTLTDARRVPVQITIKRCERANKIITWQC